MLLVLLLISVILLGVGDHLLNKYLNNNNGREAINKALPFNGRLSYDDVSIHPFRDFPNISLKLNGLKIIDTLEMQHLQTRLGP